MRKQADGSEWKIDGKSIVILTLVIVISGIFHTANTVMSGISKNGIWDFVNWSGVGPSHSVRLLEKDLNVPAVQSIRIVNSVGRLQVEGIDGNQIHLRVMEGKQAKIELIDNGPPQNRPSVDLVLQVPKRVSIIGETNAGEADVSGVANADIDANAGRVQVSNIPGTATIRTNAGSVEVREVGDAWVKTDMGRVTARPRWGRSKVLPEKQTDRMQNTNMETVNTKSLLKRMQGRFSSMWTRNGNEL